MQIPIQRILKKSAWIFPLIFFSSLGLLKIVDIDSPKIISAIISFPITFAIALILQLLWSFRTPENKEKLGYQKPLLSKHVGFHAGKGTNSFFVRGPLAKLYLYNDHFIIDASPMWSFNVPYSEIIELKKHSFGIKVNHNNKNIPNEFYITSGFGVISAIKKASETHNLGLKVT